MLSYDTIFGYNTFVNVKTPASKLSKNIKRIRKKKNITQGDICRALDMDRGYMNAIENGKKISLSNSWNA